MSDAELSHRAWTVQLAMECVDGCESDLRELLEIWLRQSPLLLCDIRSALQNDEPEKLQLAAHTLKGSLQILCADAACEYAAALEFAGEKRMTASAACALPKLEAEIADLTQLITTYLNSA